MGAMPFKAHVCYFLSAESSMNKRTVKSSTYNSNMYKILCLSY